MRVAIALLAILSVAAASDMCLPMVLSNLPMLTPVYNDFKAKNWVALQQDVVNFIPSAKNILSYCTNAKIDSPQVQACVNDITTMSGLIVHVGVNPSNKTAVGELVVEFPNIIKHFYSSCLNPQFEFSFLEDEDLVAFGFFDKIKDIANKVVDKVKDIAGDVKNVLSEAAKKTGEIAKEVAKHAATCIPQVVTTVPVFKNFVDHAQAKAAFEVIHADVVAIVSTIDGLCSACGIPKPQTAAGPVDVQKCALTALELVPVFKGVVDSKGDPTQIMGAFSSVIAALPVLTSVCGVQL